MAYSVVMLGMGSLYFRSQYENAKLFNRLLEMLKHPLDYLVKCFSNDMAVYI